MHVVQFLYLYKDQQDHIVIVQHHILRINIVSEFVILNSNVLIFLFCIFIFQQKWSSRSSRNEGMSQSLFSVFCFNGLSSAPAMLPCDAQHLVTQLGSSDMKILSFSDPNGLELLFCSLQPFKKVLRILFLLTQHVRQYG